MSFVEDPEQRDINPYVREPTRETKTFEQEPLLKIEHEDPDKHWIGETIPAPSTSEVVGAGNENFAGNSPFPARADHSHDHLNIYGAYSSFFTGDKTCPPGLTFLDNLDYSLGRDMRAVGNQVIVFPATGVWQSGLLVGVSRSGGGIFTGQAEVRFYYTNGTAFRVLWRTDLSLWDGAIFAQMTDWGHYASTVNANVQFAYAHNDVVDHLVGVHLLHVKRDSSLVSA